MSRISAKNVIYNISKKGSINRNLHDKLSDFVRSTQCKFVGDQDKLQS